MNRGAGVQGYRGTGFGIGALPPRLEVAPTEESFTISDIKTAITHVTPTLLIVGIATGAAFAVGSGLVHHFLFKGRRR